MNNEKKIIAPLSGKVIALDQVPDDVVQERFKHLLECVNKESERNTNNAVGRVEIALVEEVNRQMPGYVTGRLENNLLVHFPGCEKDLGQYIPVELSEAKGFYYLGTLIRSM